MKTGDSAINTNTSKLLIGLTLGLVVVLIIGGLWFPASLMMAFAGSTVVYTALRIVMVVLLVALLFTKPPRSKLFRTMLATWSFALAVLATQLLMTYQLHLLDAIVFLEVAIIFGVEALEMNVSSVAAASKKRVAKKIPVRKIPARRRITVATASS